MNLESGSSVAATPATAGIDGNHVISCSIPAAEQLLWRRLKDAGDQDARAELLTLHLPYAKVVAASYYAKRLHDEIEFGDYLQLASVGLIESVDRFDPAVGVLFKTFAARRMHGSILDGIERFTEKQQQIAARQRLESQRRASIKAALAAEGDTAPSKTRTPEQMLQFVAEAGLAFALAWILDGTGMVQGGEASETLPFYRNVELKQLRQRIVDLVDALPPQEKRVIRSHYFQEVPFEEIAQSMRLTKGRISQIHKQGLIHLSEALSPRQDCDVSW
jgi:RNA polymerase sigma factor FliA